MKNQHIKTLKPAVRQAIQCLREYRGAFKELSVRSGKTKSYVSKWASGIRNSDLLTELAIALCKEARETGQIKVLLQKSSARSAIAKLRGKKNGK